MNGGPLEWLILSDILRQKNLGPVIRQKLTEQHFKDKEARMIFELILQRYYSRDAPKTFPSLQYIRKRYPGFRMLPADDDRGDLATMVKELKYFNLGTELQSLAATVTDIVQGEEPEEALTLMRSMIHKIGYMHDHSGGMGLSEVFRSVRKQYDDALTGTAYGIPWPWECLTRDTMGKRPGDFIILYGRAKSMKTWVMLKCALEDVFVHKKRVMIWSKEMHKHKMALRIGSIFGDVDYQLLKHGELPPHVWERARGKFAELEYLLSMSDEERKVRRDRNEDDLLLLCGLDAPRTLAGLQQHIEAHEPDVIYMDSYYHMESPKGGKADQEKIRYVTEGVRQLALDVERPVIATHQANREGEKTFGDTMVDMARSDAGAAECDLALRIIRKKVTNLYEEDYEGYWDQQAKAAERKTRKRGIQLSKKRGIAKRPEGPVAVTPNIVRPARDRIGAEIAVMLSGNRDGVADGFLIRCVPGYDFTLLQENISPEDVKAWAKREAEEDAKDEEGKDQYKGKNKTYSAPNPNKTRKLVRGGMGIH